MMGTSILSIPWGIKQVFTKKYIYKLNLQPLDCKQKLCMMGSPSSRSYHLDYLGMINPENRYLALVFSPVLRISLNYNRIYLNLCVVSVSWKEKVNHEF